MSKPETIDLEGAKQETSSRALGFLASFSGRWEKWHEAALSINNKLQETRTAYQHRDEIFKQTKARTNACAALASGIAGFGLTGKEQREALKAVGLNLKTPEEVAATRQNLAHALQNPFLALKDMNPGLELDRVSPKILHRFDSLLKEGKYDKAAKILENSLPGRLSRAFSSRQTIEEKEMQLNALSEYIAVHKQWRAQHQAVETYAKNAEENAAAALYRTLNSSAWKKLAAEGPDGPLFQKLRASDSPAAKVLLELSTANLRRSWYGGATPALKEIKAALSRHPGSVNLPDITALFREIEADSRREMEKARALRQAAGLEKKDATIHARELNRLLDKDFTAVIGNRRVKLAEQLEKLSENPEAFDEKTTAEILRAAEKAQKGWRETPVNNFYRSLRREVPHGVVTDTARSLSDAFNAAVQWTGGAYRLGRRATAGVLDWLAEHAPGKGDPAPAPAV